MSVVLTSLTVAADVSVQFAFFSRFRKQDGLPRVLHLGAAVVVLPSGILSRQRGE